MHTCDPLYGSDDLTDRFLVEVPTIAYALDFDILM